MSREPYWPDDPPDAFDHDVRRLGGDVVRLRLESESESIHRFRCPRPGAMHVAC